MTGPLPGILGLVGVVAMTAGLAAAPVLLPARPVPVVVTDRLPVTTSPPSLVCPGPETLAVPEGGTPAGPGAPVLVTALAGTDDATVTRRPVAHLDLLGERSARARTAASSGPGRAETDPGVTIGRELTLRAGGSRPTAVRALAGTALGPAVLSADLAGGSADPAAPVSAPVSLAAVQSTLIRSGDLRSLTAISCGPGDTDQWLVGGATGEGERLRLLLANPAGTPAVADVEVHGPDGRVRTDSAEGVVVPAGGQVPLYVDALAPGLTRVAVHVSTRTGRVRAILHDWRLDGLAPGGADDVAPAARPARRQVIPGVSLVDGFGRTATDPAAPGSTFVRVAVPGAEEAVVRLRLLDSSGAVELPDGAVTSVPAGSVTDIPVARVPSGTYTAVVEADVPVVAAARVGRSAVAHTSPAAEFAWAAAGAGLTGPGYFALPPGVRSTLSLVATGRSGRLTVTEVLRDGTAGPRHPVLVPAGTSATVRLGSAAVAVRVHEFGGGPVAASVVCWTPAARGTLISVLALEPVAVTGAPAGAVEDRTLGLRR